MAEGAEVTGPQRCVREAVVTALLVWAVVGGAACGSGDGGSSGRSGGLGGSDSGGGLDLPTGDSEVAVPPEDVGAFIGTALQDVDGEDGVIYLPDEHPDGEQVVGVDLDTLEVVSEIEVENAAVTFVHGDDLWIVTHDPVRVLQVDRASMEVTWETDLYPNGQPAAMAATDDGWLWGTDPQTGRIFRIRPDTHEMKVTDLDVPMVGLFPAGDTLWTSLAGGGLAEIPLDTRAVEYMTEPRVDCPCARDGDTVWWRAGTTLMALDLAGGDVTEVGLDLTPLRGIELEAGIAFLEGSLWFIAEGGLEGYAVRIDPGSGDVEEVIPLPDSLPLNLAAVDGRLYIGSNTLDGPPFHIVTPG